MKKLLLSIVSSCLLLSLFAQSTADQQAIHQVVQTMAEGWTEGDGKKFASVFANEHDFIVWNGYYFKGMNPQMNATNHQGIFNTIYKNTSLHAVVDKIKFIREDIAMSHVLGAVAKPGEERPEHPQVLISCLLERTKGSWKIVSFHNLDLEVFQDEQTKQNAPMPAEVMYAGWYNKNGGR